jgi:hypothetical protein
VLKNIRNGFVLSAALLFSSTAAFSDAVIDVNNTCESSTCTPGTLSPGGSDSGSFNFNVTLKDGDQYNFTGNYLDTLSADGTQPQVNMNIRGTLISAPGGVSATDDINIEDLIDSFVWGYPSGTFYENATFSFGGALATSSSGGESYLTVGVTKMPILGPFYPPTTQSGSDTEFINTPGENPLQLDLEDIMEFGAGSMPGAYIQEGFSSVPEPAYGIPMVSTVLLLAFLRIRRARLTRQ